MTGEYNHSIDSKGRLFMPAKLREELGDVFFICKGLDGCLFVYSEANWREYERKVNALPISQTISIQRTIFSTAAKCEPDLQGRVNIGQKLRDYAGLDKNVTVVGVGNHAEIWNSTRWAELSAGQSEESLAAIMDQLGF